MKRGARQHGTVGTYRNRPSPWNPKPKTRLVQRLNSPVVAELFSNMPSEASNHFKFTGKCGRPQCLECHLNPVSKSKNKTKGTHKFKASNMVVGPRLITRQPDLMIFSGLSASGILEHLYYVNEEDDIDDRINDFDDECEYEYEYDDGDTCAILHDDINFMANFWALHEREIEEYVDDDKLGSVYGYGDDDDDDAISFCDVDLFMLDQTEEDEGWCLVTEM